VTHCPQAEQRLVARANRGDAAAFEELYRAHREWVVALAWRFTGNREDALDVLQDSFAYLFDRFPGFRLTSSLRAYLYPVVRHRSLSLARKRRKVVPIDRGSNPPDELTWRPEPAGDFARLIDDLSPEHREVVRLRFALGFTLDEIAAALELPLGTVKSRLHNALKTLKERHAKKT
jgi:RNA polymerase sigma-70 factor (ECF subfamily)